MGNRAISNDLIILGNYIRNRRKEMHLSQEMLAEKAEISSNTVSRIECGQSAMSVEVFMRIVQILGMDVGEILGVPEFSMEDDGRLQAMAYQIRHLRSNEREIVLSTVETLVNNMRKYRI